MTGRIRLTPMSLRRNTDGVAAVEFALILPLLLFLILASATFFDYFLQRQSVERSIHTVGDYLSRQTSINETRVDWMKTLMTEMVRSRSGELSLRVTSFESRENQMYRRWQIPVGAPWPNGDFETDKLPEIPNGDSAIVVEVSVPYRPPFATGFELSSLDSFAIYRPRFVATIPFQ